MHADPRGESYLDLVQRLEPVITEMEREGESIAIVAHQVRGWLLLHLGVEVSAYARAQYLLVQVTDLPLLCVSARLSWHSIVDLCTT